MTNPCCLFESLNFCETVCCMFFFGDVTPTIHVFLKHSLKSNFSTLAMKLFMAIDCIYIIYIYICEHVGSTSSFCFFVHGHSLPSDVHPSSRCECEPISTPGAEEPKSQQKSCKGN